MRCSVHSVLALLAASLVLPVAPASAQVLIWSLPKTNGAWVRFEGTYKQTRARPTTNAGEEVLEWRSELTISAVGSETVEMPASDDADSDAQSGVSNEVPCRWVEFKTVIKPNGLEKQLGPGDQFIYKVLVPEHRVIGKPVDDNNIPVTFLPIVKGWRKVGQRDAVPVAEKALAVYPTVALVTYYPDLKAEVEEAEQLQIGGEAVAARVFKGTRVVYQRTTNRSTNVGTLWRSDDVPFGLARFQVSVTLEEKEIAAPVDEFKRTSLIEVDMTVVATGDDARSALGDDQPAADKPVGDDQGAPADDDEPADDKPAAEKPADDEPDEEMPAEDKSTDEKPAGDQDADEKPADDDAEEKPAADKGDDEPADEKPADETPEDDKEPAEADEEMPAEETQEKPEDEPDAEQGSDEPADEKPADE
jgi:hypothetical protein